jgi:hypothetical protein
LSVLAARVRELLPRDESCIRIEWQRPRSTARHPFESPNGSLENEDKAMLWTLAVVFLVLWAMGFVAFHVTSGFIHLLLIAAVVVVGVRLLSGRAAV